MVVGVVDPPLLQLYVWEVADASAWEDDDWKMGDDDGRLPL